MSIEITGPGEVTTRPYSLLRELENNDEVALWPTAVPERVALETTLELEAPNGDAVYETTTAYLSVFDAMKLRAGLDAFISQAVGADV